MVAVTRMVSSKPDGKTDATRSMPLCPKSSSSLPRRLQQRGQKTSMLFFLTMAICLSFFLTLGKSNNNCGGDNEDNGGASDCGLNGKERAVESLLEQDSITAGRTTTTATINIADPTNNLAELLLSPRSNESQDRIWVVFAYRETCEQSMKLLRKLNYSAIPRIEFNYDNRDENGNLYRPEMNFVPMPLNDNEISVELKEKFLKGLGIIRLPSLFFLWDEEEEELENTLHLENVFATVEVYRGRSESIADLVNGLYHYLSRLQLRPVSPLKRQEYQQFGDRALPLTAIPVDSLGDLRNVVWNTNEKKLFQNPPLPLDPNLSKDDDRWIRYLMDDNSGVTNSSPDYDLYHDDMNGRNNADKKNDKATKDEVGTCPQHQPMRERYHLVVQCRNNMGKKIIDEKQNVKSSNLQARRSSSQRSTVQLYQEYDLAIKTLGTRRDVLFSILEPVAEDREMSQLPLFCDVVSDDGLVKVWDFHLNEPLAKLGVDDECKKDFFEEHVNISANIINQLSSVLRPEVLWFDRRMTAPIAFHPRYRRHAILFVDFHDRTSASKTRDVVRLFRQECRQLKNKQQSKMNDLNSVLNQSVVEMIDGDDGENSFVCLIVPSTEIRVLNTFGIDIWSNLDLEATEKIRTTLCHSRNREANDVLDDVFCDVYKDNKKSKNPESNGSKFSSGLPMLLVTDRRKDGTIQRHYLDPPITSRSLSDFVNDFVHGRTEPEKKSSPANDHFTEGGSPSFPTNKHFINLLTAESLPLFLKSNREKHVLVQLYAPTCGHCKRFNIIWNSLGKLIKHLGWSNQLLLARIDVTSNEIIVPGMAATWLPDLFYFGVGVSENPIHYEKTPLADEVELGSISNPLELLEWWMDEAGDVINEAGLLHVLEKKSAVSA